MTPINSASSMTTNKLVAASRPRLSGLEVSRGLAAMSVVLFHLAAIYLPLPPGSMQKVIGSLGGAVPFFFALSAFSLCLGYDATIFSPDGLQRFYIRRIYRILPLFYLMLAAYSIKTLIAGYSISQADLILNMLFLFPFFPGKQESMVWAGWSLGIECLFYMVFPVVALLSRQLVLNLAAVVVLSLAAVAVHRVLPALGLNPAYSVMNLPSNLIYFFAGTLAYSMVQAIQRTGHPLVFFARLRRLFFPVLLASIVVLVLYKFCLSAKAQAQSPLEPLLAAVSGVWILMAYAGLPAALDNRVTQHIGKLSYGIYLVHPFVLWALAEVGLFKLIGAQIASPHLALCIAGAIAIPVVLASAEAAYRLVESPGIALGEKLLPARK